MNREGGVPSVPQNNYNNIGSEFCCIFEGAKTMFSEPEFVPIGPIYFSNINVDLKYRYVSQMMRRTGLSEEYLMETLKPLENRVRASYSSLSSLEWYTERVIDNMILDGCFVLELMRKYVGTSGRVGFEPDDPIACSSLILPKVVRDLLRVGNQLPFFILLKLFTETNNNDNTICLTDMCFEFFGCAVALKRPPEVVEKMRAYEKKVDHLLDLLRASFIVPLEPNHKLEESKSTTTGSASSSSAAGGDPGGRTDKNEFLSLIPLMTSGGGSGNSAEDESNGHQTVRLEIPWVAVGTHHGPLRLEFPCEAVGTHHGPLRLEIPGEAVGTHHGPLRLEIVIRKEEEGGGGRDAGGSTTTTTTTHEQRRLENQQPTFALRIPYDRGPPITKMSEMHRSPVYLMPIHMKNDWATEKERGGVESSAAGPGNESGGRESVAAGHGNEGGCREEDADSAENINMISLRRTTYSPLILCVSELQHAGIKIRTPPSGRRMRQPNNNTFLEVRFKRGVIEMPTIIIDDMMSCFLVQCVSYEMRKRNCSTYFSTYTTLLSWLALTPNDVDHLCRAGVIRNRIGSQTNLASFLENLGKDVAIDLDRCYLADLFREVENYYDNKWHVQWAGFKQTYFGTPWIFISALAASVVLIFTFLQTLYTILSYY